MKKQTKSKTKTKKGKPSKKRLWPNENIPREFQLFGHTITVEFTSKLVDKNDAQGMSYYREDRIELQNFNHPPYTRTREQIEVTFLHELIHFILLYMDRPKLRMDEHFVGQFALSLHQAIRTAKYGTKKSSSRSLFRKEKGPQ